jgi:hypothetical protein
LDWTLISLPRIDRVSLIPSLPSDSIVCDLVLVLLAGHGGRGFARSVADAVLSGGKKGVQQQEAWPCVREPELDG